MTGEQERGPRGKRLPDALMDHHRGRGQDKLESVLDIEPGIIEENILRACTDIYR
jgi:hypothetical protein